MFRSPYYPSQSATTGNIYVSDRDKDPVICLMSDGSTVYQYKDKDLKLPCGVCVDDDENIFACCSESNNREVKIFNLYSNV